MSNRVTIEPTEFKNIRSGTTSLGVRVYDDYDKDYDNTWDEIPVDDMDILQKVLESDSRIISDMMDSVRCHEKGITIGDNYYDWDEIKSFFSGL